MPTLPGKDWPCLRQSFVLSDQERSYKAGSVCTNLLSPLVLYSTLLQSPKALGQEQGLSPDLQEGVAEAWVGTKDPKWTLSKVWRPILLTLPFYSIRKILMNTWTSFISPLPNYLAKCHEPEAWACSPDVSLFSLA